MRAAPSQEPSKPTPSKRQFVEMGIMEHLSDLRSCIIHSVASIVLLSFVTYAYSSYFFELLTRPFRNIFGETVLIGTGPAEALTLKIYVAFFTGTLFALPYIFYQLWKFISPGLYDQEKKYVFPFILITTACFLAGIFFGYELVLPISFDFFKEEYKSIALTPQIKLSEHLSLTIKILIGFGAIFELPVISFVLARVGILTAHAMKSTWRYVIVAIFIIAGVLTPPDALSQCLMAGPMLLLYGVSILVVQLSERRTTTPTT